MSADGSGVGTVVGTGIGTLVGAGIGTAVGAGIGTLVGAGIGTVVGDGIGTAVDAGIGTLVGAGIGTVVGDGIGTAVDAGIGTLVGAGIGTTVGTGIGTVVGAEVAMVGHAVPIEFPVVMNQLPVTPLESACTSVGTSEQNEFSFSLQAATSIGCQLVRRLLGMGTRGYAWVHRARVPLVTLPPSQRPTLKVDTQ